MPDRSIARATGRVAIVDYGMGNLFSVQRACEHAGLRGIVTSSSKEILEADAVVLPGVGAFGTAVEHLERLDLMGVLRDAASSEKPLLGVCLGMQLLMNESAEFGAHRGLCVIDGQVLYLEEATAGLPGLNGEQRVKVPHVGWSKIYVQTSSKGLGDAGNESSPWQETPLDGLNDGDHLYFVHSLYVKPADPSVVLSTTRYGGNDFCSSFSRGNVFGCQFHPERSGKVGLKIYRNLAKRIVESQQGYQSVTEVTGQVWPS